MTDSDARRTDAPEEPDDERLTHGRWRKELLDGRLLGQRCLSCGHETAAPKAACAACGSRSLRTIEFPDTGTVYSETTIQVPPEGFEGPYEVALVSVGEGRVTARIDGDASIGDSVAFDGVLESESGVAPVFTPTEE